MIEKKLEKPRPTWIPPGTKIYRIIGANRVDGPYWSYELPEGVQEWRAGSAVKEAWNSNGYYVEYTVGPGGLSVWEGKAASQTFEREGASDSMYGRGDTQIYVPNADSVIPKNLTKMKTPWSDEK